MQWKKIKNGEHIKKRLEKENKKNLWLWNLKFEADLIYKFLDNDLITRVNLENNFKFLNSIKI